MNINGTPPNLTPPTSTPHGATDGQKMRIGIATQDPYRAENVEQTINGAGWQAVPIVGNKPTADTLTEQSLDLLIVDLDINGAVGLLSELALQQPDLPLLALATPEHLIELQDALLAGAKAFVPFPVNEQQFIATVVQVMNAQVLQTASPQPNQPALAPELPNGKQGRIIAVTGLKGGVGRSTIAANLAVSLQDHEQDQDVILVEAHHGLSDLSIMLNLVPTRTLADLATQETIDADILSGSLHRHESGIRLLTAPTELTKLGEIAPDRWHQILTLLTGMAQTIIIDTGADPDDALSEVLTLADDIIVVTGPDMASLNGVRTLLKTLRGEGSIQGKLHLVLNRAGLKGSVSTSSIAKRLEQKITVELPDDSALATYSLNRGVPLVISHPRALLARCMEQLAMHLVGKAKPRVAPAKSKSKAKETIGPFAQLRNRAALVTNIF